MYKFFTCSSYTLNITKLYAQKDSRTLNKPEVLRSSWFRFTYLQIPPGLYKFPCKVVFFPGIFHLGDKGLGTSISLSKPLLSR